MAIRPKFVFIGMALGLLCLAVVYLPFMSKATHPQAAAQGNQESHAAQLMRSTADSITTIQGEPLRTIYVFASPTCIHCKNLERSLLSFQDVQIHTFLLSPQGSKAFALAADIWCSAEPSKAYSEWMLNDQTPESSQECDAAPLSRNMALANALGVSGTPTVFFEDGSKVDGFREDAIRSKLADFAPHEYSR